MARILPSFWRHPEAGQMIGEMVTGYGELEILLAWACAWLNGDMDTVFKVMFRSPGEMARILAADALVRGKLKRGRVRTHFEQAIAAMHHCRKIRNQYAHATWGDDARGLWFVNLEENACLDDAFDLRNLTQHVVDLPLLQAQEDYFCFLNDRLDWLTFEGQVMAGHMKSNPRKPVHRSGPLPKLHR